MQAAKKFIEVKNSKKNLLNKCDFKFRSEEEIKMKKYETFKIIINSALYLIKQGLPFRGKKEDDKSLNKWNFLSLIDFACSIYKNIEKNIKDFEIPISSTKLQNKIIQWIYEIVYEKMTENIKNANFLSLILDESTDVKNSTQLAVGLKFVLQGKIYENFLKFINLEDKKTANDIVDSISEISEKIDFKVKLICQSYDGAAVMAGRINGVATQIKKISKCKFYLL